jgi:hypothetical protein
MAAGGYSTGRSSSAASFIAAASGSGLELDAVVALGPRSPQAPHVLEARVGRHHHPERARGALDGRVLERVEHDVVAQWASSSTTARGPSLALRRSPSAMARIKPKEAASVSRSRFPGSSTSRAPMRRRARPRGDGLAELLDAERLRICGRRSLDAEEPREQLARGGRDLARERRRGPEDRDRGARPDAPGDGRGLAGEPGFAETVIAEERHQDPRSPTRT